MADAMRAAAVFVLVGLASAPPLAAQSRPIELGLDAGLTYSFVDGSEEFDFFDPEDVTSANIPFQRVRVGFPIGDRAQIEPSLGLFLVDQGDDSLTQLNLALAGLYHFTGDATRPRWYLQLGAGVSIVDVDDESDNQFGVGGGLGVKLPAGDRLAVRLEGNLVRTFESDLRFAATTLGALVGFSFFTG